jgi:hypothetical protein
MSYKSQWVHVPAGASGSSTTKAKLRVAAGSPDHSRDGETSAPSREWSDGMGAPLGKAAEKRVKGMGGKPLAISH